MHAAGLAVVLAMVSTIHFTHISFLLMAAVSAMAAFVATVMAAATFVIAAMVTAMAFIAVIATRMLTIVVMACCTGRYQFTLQVSLHCCVGISLRT
jgi:hypothetical protein